GLSGVLGGERRFRAQDIRAIPGPGGTVTVGVRERDGGIAVVNSELFVEGLDFTYENLQLDLAKAGVSALNVDLNVISLPEAEQPGGDPRPLILGPGLRSQQAQQRPSFLSGTILTYEVGRQTLSLEFDEFVNYREFDESHVDRVSLSVRTSSGLNVEIDRIYFVPEPASVLSFLIGVLPLIGGMRRRA
ncbi:MAG: PEP-CTERM sorting domain-containing protein, partial [Planctomycetales bacterium]|nr:PEP-CTERM sorting domain-containing protein [Planctomycetales bacterium]